MSGSRTHRSVRPDKFGLASWKAHGFGLHRPFMEPARRRIGAHYRNAVAVGEEFAQPRHVSVAATKRRINKYHSIPWLDQTIIVLGEMRFAGTQWSGPGEQGSRSKVKP